jgi:hypothetical protein
MRYCFCSLLPPVFPAENSLYMLQQDETPAIPAGAGSEPIVHQLADTGQ